jgi:hypothetical protein
LKIQHSTSEASIRLPYESFAALPKRMSSSHLFARLGQSVSLGYRDCHLAIVFPENGNDQSGSSKEIGKSCFLVMSE